MSKKQVKWDLIEPTLGGWAPYLKDWFLSETAYNLFAELAEIKQREIVTPLNNTMFKFLELLPPEKLNVILIGMDAYPGKYANNKLHATGLAFDCSNSPNKKCQPSLEYFWKGLNNEYGKEFEPEYDIRYLTIREGIMLGNRAICCKLNKTGSLMGKFDCFWEYFLGEIIPKHFQCTPVVLLGKDAHRLQSYIFDLVNPVFKLSHPSFAARNHAVWETEGVFKQIDKYLVEFNKKPIEWRLKR